MRNKFRRSKIRESLKKGKRSSLENARERPDQKNYGQVNPNPLIFLIKNLLGP